jgi:tripartite ATP-independent transporter DctP family solute receptor
MPGIQAKPVAPQWSGRQFHVLPEHSHQHRFLVDLWDSVRAETGGRLDITVHAQSDGATPGSHDALEMLVRGDLEFYSLNGNAIGKLVPAAEVQGVPYAFATSGDVHRANDGALGAYLSRECAAKGIVRFQRGLMENGFRQTFMFDRPIRHVDDLAGMKIRTPAAGMIRDVMASLGAEPVVINILDIRKALEERRVDGHENPLIVMHVGGFDALTPYVSLTRHMWTGFNVIGSAKFWDRLPEDVQAIVDANVTRAVAAQRAYTIDMNERLAGMLAGRGAIVTEADTESFRRKLRADGFYARWKERVGATAWGLLEESVGVVG